MTWQVEYSRTALKQLGKLDKPVARRILDYLEAIVALDNPRDRGKALIGDKAGLWRYRVGNYRIICSIDDGRCVVLALEVGHRAQIY